MNFNPIEIRNWQVPGQEQVITTPHPSVRLTNGVPSYLHRDHLGSVRAISDATGAKIESAVYKPFGEQTETLSPANLTPESKGWIGERFDADAGLQYLNARYYDPVLGLFLQPDWFEVLQPGVGTNRFSYSFNDPVNKLDPMGNLAKCVACSGTGMAKSGTLSPFSRDSSSQTARQGSNIIPARTTRTAQTGSANQQLISTLTPSTYRQIDTLRAELGLSAQARIGPPVGQETMAGLNQARSELQSLRLQVNVLSGRIAEQQTNTIYGGAIVGNQVTVITSTGMRTRIDNIINLESARIVNETKSSTTARLTPAQQQLLDDIFNARPVTPVGGNALRAGLEPGRPVVFDGYVLTVPSTLIGPLP